MEKPHSRENQRDRAIGCNSLQHSCSIHFYCTWNNWNKCCSKLKQKIYLILFYCRSGYMCNKCCNLFYCSIYFILLHTKPHHYELSVGTLSAHSMPVYSAASNMTFTTNCLRASGIIRKQLVHLDSVMHPPPSSSAPGEDPPSRGSTTTTPRFLLKFKHS